jgi:hypothetical protein
MRLYLRAVLAASLLLLAPAAFADDIDAGLWNITTWLETNGAIGLPMQSTKCLKPEETRDVATTFSPVPRTINSECAPLERTFDGKRLSWKLVCKGQLDMEITGDFVFDGPRRYVATIRNRAAMAGMQVVNTRTMIEAEWASQCP